MAHLAARNGNIQVLEALLEDGANKDIVDRWGRTPLHTAVVAGNTHIAALLSKQGATIKVSDPAGEMCSAATTEDLEQVRLPSAHME